MGKDVRKPDPTRAGQATGGRLKPVGPDGKPRITSIGEVRTKSPWMYFDSRPQPYVPQDAGKFESKDTEKKPPAITTPAPNSADAEFYKRFGGWGGVFDPAMRYDPSTIAKSNMAGVHADPVSIAAQYKALANLLQVADGGGFTAQEEAARLGRRADADQWLRAQREADLSDMAERGMSGSGSELAALSADRSAAAQRMSMSDVQTQALREQRALDAIMQVGDLGGKMRESSFGEGSARAMAQDELDVYNNDLTNAGKKDEADFFRGVAKDWRDKRYASEMKDKELGIDTAKAILDFDQDDNQWAGGTTLGLSGQTAEEDNTANAAHRGATIGAVEGGGSTESAALRGANKLHGEAIVTGAASGEELLEDVVKVYGKIYGAKGGGGAGKATAASTSGTNK